MERVYLPDETVGWFVGKIVSVVDETTVEIEPEEDTYEEHELLCNKAIHEV